MSTTSRSSHVSLTHTKRPPKFPERFKKRKLRVSVELSAIGGRSDLIPVARA